VSVCNKRWMNQNVILKCW